MFHRSRTPPRQEHDKQHQANKLSYHPISLTRKRKSTHRIPSHHLTRKPANSRHLIFLMGFKKGRKGRGGAGVSSSTGNSPRGCVSARACVRESPGMVWSCRLGDSLSCITRRCYYWTRAFGNWLVDREGNHTASHHAEGGTGNESTADFLDGEGTRSWDARSGGMCIGGLGGDRCGAAKTGKGWGCARAVQLGNDVRQG